MKLCWHKMLYVTCHPVESQLSHTVHPAYFMLLIAAKAFCDLCVVVEHAVMVTEVSLRIRFAPSVFVFAGSSNSFSASAV